MARPPYAVRNPKHNEVYTRYLRLWARLVVRRRRPLVIAVTGSVGKTTTKETVAAVLSQPEARAAVGEVWATPGNMNDNRGVPLTLLGYRGWRPRGGSEALRALTVPARALWMATLGRYPRVLMLEYGAGVGGDVGRSVRLAAPDVGIVTAVGPSHLEVFGTVETVAHVKGEVVRAVPPSGLVVLGADSARASALEAETGAAVVKVPGKGQAFANAAARVVARHLGVPDEAVDRALAGRKGPRGRQEAIELDAVTVINDAFNANPLSMAYGLETLAERSRAQPSAAERSRAQPSAAERSRAQPSAAERSRRAVAILGEMAEMGAAGPQYHREMAATAGASADLVVGVGPLAKLYDPDHWFETSAECARAVPDLVRSGDYVLVKGSHSSRLSTVVNALKDEFGAVAAES